MFSAAAALIGRQVLTVQTSLCMKKSKGGEETAQDSDLAQSAALCTNVQRLWMWCGTCVSTVKSFCAAYRQKFVTVVGGAAGQTQRSPSRERTKGQVQSPPTPLPSSSSSPTSARLETQQLSFKTTQRRLVFRRLVWTNAAWVLLICFICLRNKWIVKWTKRTNLRPSASSDSCKLEMWSTI